MRKVLGIATLSNRAGIGGARVRAIERVTTGYRPSPSVVLLSSMRTLCPYAAENLTNLSMSGSAATGSGTD